MITATSNDKVVVKYDDIRSIAQKFSLERPQSCHIRAGLVRKQILLHSSVSPRNFTIQNT